MAAAASGGSHITPEQFVELVHAATDNSLVKEIIRQMDIIGRKHYSGGRSGYISYGEPGVSENKQTDNVQLTKEQLDLIRTQFGLHKDKDMRVENLPSMIGHSGLLDLSEFSAGRIRILDPMEVFETIPSVKPKRVEVKISRSVPGTKYSIETNAQRPAAIEHMKHLAAEMGPGYTWNISGEKNFVINKLVIEKFTTSTGIDGGSGAVVNAKGAKAIYETGNYLIIDITSGDHDDINKKPADIYLRIRAPAVARAKTARNRTRTNKNRNRTAKNEL